MQRPRYTDYLSPWSAAKCAKNDRQDEDGYSAFLPSLALGANDNREGQTKETRFSGTSSVNYPTPSSTAWTCSYSSSSRDRKQATELSTDNSFRGSVHESDRVSPLTVASSMSEEAQDDLRSFASTSTMSMPFPNFALPCIRSAPELMVAADTPKTADVPRRSPWAVEGIKTAASLAVSKVRDLHRHNLHRTLLHLMQEMHDRERQRLVKSLHNERRAHDETKVKKAVRHEKVVKEWSDRLQATRAGLGRVHMEAQRTWERIAGEANRSVALLSQQRDTSEMAVRSLQSQEAHLLRKMEILQKERDQACGEMAKLHNQLQVAFQHERNLVDLRATHSTSPPLLQDVSMAPAPPRSPLATELTSSLSPPGLSRQFTASFRCDSTSNPTPIGHHLTQRSNNHREHAQGGRSSPVWLDPALDGYLHALSLTDGRDATSEWPASSHVTSSNLTPAGDYRGNSFIGKGPSASGPEEPNLELEQGSHHVTQFGEKVHRSSIVEEEHSIVGPGYLLGRLSPTSATFQPANMTSDACPPFTHNKEQEHEPPPQLPSNLAINADFRSARSLSSDLHRNPPSSCLTTPPYLPTTIW